MCTQKQFYRYYIIPSIHKIDFWSETILMDTKTLNDSTDVHAISLKGLRTMVMAVL